MFRCDPVRGIESIERERETNKLQSQSIGENLNRPDNHTSKKIVENQKKERWGKINERF